MPFATKFQPPDPTKENEFRKVGLDEYVREFSERFREGVVPDADNARFIEEISSSLGWPEVTFVRSVKDQEPPRNSTPESGSRVMQAAWDSAITCLVVLQALSADGDEAALAELVHHLNDNLSWLEGYSYRDKGNLKAVAADADGWPVMLNQRPRQRRQTADYLERIGLKSDPHAIPDLNFLPNQDAEPLRLPNSETKARMICEASYSAGRWLGDLRLLVGSGDAPATLLFVALLAENTAWLESYSTCDKGNIKAIARLAPVWPVMMARSSGRTKNASDYLKRIELGTKAQISSSPKWGTSWANEGAIATHYARAIRLAVGNARNFFQSFYNEHATTGPLARAAWENVQQWVKDAGRLPPLTKESGPQWFEIGWQLLVKKCNGQPGSDELLRKLGAYRAGKYARRYKQIAGPSSSARVLSRKTSPPRTAAADIQDGIKTRLSEALMSLAPPS